MDDLPSRHTTNRRITVLRFLERIDKSPDGFGFVGRVFTAHIIAAKPIAS